MIGKPEILFPKAIGNLIFFLEKSLLDIISLKYTFSRNDLGNSIPTELLPGMVAILVDSELVFLAISSDKFIIFETLTPGAGSNSFKVTTGPLLIFIILPSTPKSKRIFSRVFSFIFMSEEFSLSFLVGFFKNSIAGSLNLIVLVSDTGSFLNEKFS